MIFVQTEKDTHIVKMIHYLPFDEKYGLKDEEGNQITEEELKKIGFLTELQPDPQPPEGYYTKVEKFTEEEGFTYEYEKKPDNPYGIPDDLVTRIKDDAITEVQEAVKNGLNS